MSVQKSPRINNSRVENIKVLFAQWCSPRLKLMQACLLGNYRIDTQTVLTFPKLIGI